MVWSLLAYPFALAARRPLGVLGPLGIGLALCIAFDLAAAASGIDTFSSATGFLWESLRNNLFSAGLDLLWVFLIGFVMAVAITDLGERPNDRPTLDDGLGLLALNALYGIVVIVPMRLVVGGAFLFVKSLFPGITDEVVLTALTAPYMIALAYASARFAFAGPLTLVRGKITILSAWPETRGRVLPIVGLNIASFLVIALVVAVGSVPAWLFSQSDPQPVQTLQAALAPRALIEMFAQEATVMFVIGYYSATQAYVFHRLKPKEASQEAAAQAT